MMRRMLMIGIFEVVLMRRLLRELEGRERKVRKGIVLKWLLLLLFLLLLRRRSNTSVQL